MQGMDAVHPRFQVVTDFGDDSKLSCINFQSFPTKFHVIQFTYTFSVAPFSTLAEATCLLIEPPG